jgi:hypothetical protein
MKIDVAHVVSSFRFLKWSSTYSSEIGADFVPSFLIFLLSLSNGHRTGKCLGFVLDRLKTAFHTTTDIFYGFVRVEVLIF